MSSPSVSSTSSAWRKTSLSSITGPNGHVDASPARRWRSSGRRRRHPTRPTGAGGSAAVRRPGRRPRPPGATRRSGRAGRSAAGASSPVSIVSTPRGSASSRSTTAAATSSNVGAAGDRLALEEAEERPSWTARPSSCDVARRGRHRSGGDGGDRLLHLGRVLRRRAGAVVGDHRRDPGRDRARADDHAPAWARARQPARREDDVRVVREHDDLRRGGRVDRGEDIGGRRVHRLAALDDAASRRGCGRAARCLRRRRPRRPRSRADPARARAGASRAARSGGACSRSRSPRAPRGRRRG